MDLNEALDILKNAGLLTEKTALTLDTEAIDYAIGILQKHKERLVPIGEELAKALPENGITPSEFGIGKNEDGRFVLWIGMPRNRWYSIAAYDDGLEIVVDGEYTITTTKEEYLPKLLKAIKK
jgi:hypothetical protein